jgi:hypothetical protein
MAVGRAQRQAIDGPELFDLLEGLRGEGGLAFEGVKDDALEEVAQGHVFLFGDGFQDFQQALFEAHAGLHADDFDGMFGGHIGTIVPWYPEVWQGGRTPDGAGVVAEGKTDPSPAKMRRVRDDMVRGAWWVARRGARNLEAGR